MESGFSVTGLAVEDSSFPATWSLPIAAYCTVFVYIVISSISRKTSCPDNLRLVITTANTPVSPVNQTSSVNKHRIFIT